VYCGAGLICAHWRVFTFDELAVPDELPVIIFRASAVSFARNAGAGKYRLDRNGRREAERAVLQPVNGLNPGGRGILRCIITAQSMR
jgi:hypothetical protein